MNPASFALTTVTETLERVLEHLTAIQLLRIQPVCKSWLYASQNVLKRRKCELTYATIIDLEDDTFYHQSNSNDSLLQTKRARLEPPISGWRKGSMCEKQLKKYSEEWNTLPTFVIANFDNEPGLSLQNLNSDMEDVSATVTSYLPPNCDLVLIRTIDGLVCSDETKSHSEFEFNYLSFTNLFSFPMNQTDFSIDVLHLPSMNKSHKNNFKSSLSAAVGDPKLKTMLIFHKPRACIMQLASEELNKAVSNNVVVAGCMVPNEECNLIYYKRRYSNDEKKMTLRSRRKTNPYSGTNFSNGLIAILFKGNKLKSASILIGSHINSIKGLDAKLKELKNTVNNFYPPCEKCTKKQNYESCSHVQHEVFAYMIACCSRANGDEWFDSEVSDNDGYNRAAVNQEQISFRLTFPDMPLFGVHGIGEIGADINIQRPGQTQSSMSTSKSSTKIKNHHLRVTGCTIFVVIGL